MSFLYGSCILGSKGLKMLCTFIYLAWFLLNVTVLFLYMELIWVDWLILISTWLFDRVGSCFKPLSVACYDKYDNYVPFASIPKLDINLISNGTILAEAHSKKVDITLDRSKIIIKVIISASLMCLSTDASAKMF